MASPPPRSTRPTRAELEAAAGRTVPDVLEPGVRLAFCGINPGLWSGAVGHHFARPGNRFWKVLHGAGFTDGVLDPSEERELLTAGIGITNLVSRSTATAAELSRDELRAGAARLAGVVGELGVGWVAFLGMGAYRTAFGRPQASLGEQPERLGGARIWLLPNPSGLQARYQLAELILLFGELRQAAFGPAGAGGT
jgi:TDG/mug DNA glycosylase family protein